MKQVLSISVMGVFAFLFYASSSPKYVRYVEISYANTGGRKSSTDTTITYQHPVISLEDGTQQTQIKGGVSITCELVPISINKSETTIETYIYRDPAKPNLDVKQVAHRPKYSLSPEEIQLKVTINNNQGRVLKLRDCAIVMIVDNLQYSLPQDVMTQWEGSNVISGFSTVIYLKGPQLSTLTRPKSVEVFINDVPTSFDQAGNVLKRENFEWLFICKSETKTVDDKVTYTYSETPVKVEQCSVCKGVGHIEFTQQCTKCGGDGTFVGAIDKKTYKCDRCDGTGRETVKNDCSTCGGDGAIHYPKSTFPPVASQVTWTGYIVQVVSTPPGATVSVYDSNQKKYVDQITPAQVEWVQNGSEAFPIMVKYDDETIKVLPFSSTNKPLSKVEIDFSGATALVKSGTAVK